MGGRDTRRPLFSCPSLLSAAAAAPVRPGAIRVRRGQRLRWSASPCVCGLSDLWIFAHTGQARCAPAHTGGHEGRGAWDSRAPGAQDRTPGRATPGADFPAQGGPGKHKPGRGPARIVMHGAWLRVFSPWPLPSPGFWARVAAALIADRTSFFSLGSVPPLCYLAQTQRAQCTLFTQLR